ncbi:MAG: TQO small subunit DoxD [Acidiphilium sp.]
MPFVEPLANRRPPSAQTTAALALLSVRFVQGWIYWGGGTRRFIYAPQKLNPHAAHWMAYKFQTAMPGAILGTERLIAFLLHHFWLLYLGVVGFSAVEMIAGFMLLAGLFTRAAALATIGLSFVLMLLFGWQGATCIDEWTMAVANFGMGITLLLAGGGAYTLDSLLLRRYPALAGGRWFAWTSGAQPLPLAERGFKRLALILFWIGVAFTVLTYNYYRGSVVTPYHKGQVSPSTHHWTLSQGRLAANGTVRFKAYADAGTAAEPSNVVAAWLTNASGVVVESWKGKVLAALPAGLFHNEFPYQRFHAGKFGIAGPVGAIATITLPAAQGRAHAGAALVKGAYQLSLISVNGHVWTSKLTWGQ